MSNVVKRECPVCATTYDADPVRLRHGRQTTCSRACSYALRAGQLERREVVECAVCEVEFTRSPAQIKSKHGAVYCSPACMYAGRTLGLTPRVATDAYVRATPFNREAHARAVETRKSRDNYGHSDETRARLREATASAIAEGRIPAVSGLEDLVAAELERQGVAFERQVAVRGTRGRFVACADFMLEDGRALEVNGTFWHADPRAYPDGPIFPAQIRTAERWLRKMDALAGLGVVVLVAWEQDLRDDLAQTLRVTLG